jgi:hypothetical protein
MSRGGNVALLYPSARRRAVEIALEQLRQGRSMRRAAREAEVHRSTLARWRRADSGLDQQFRDALRHGRTLRRIRRDRLTFNFSTLTHPDCPVCGAAVEVRSAARGIRFWRCQRWPTCPWSSWRPRHPDDCPDCGGPRLWSHSRKSAACTRCGARQAMRRIDPLRRFAVLRATMAGSKDERHRTPDA